MPRPVRGLRGGRCCRLEGVRGGRAFCAGSGRRVVDASTLDAGGVVAAGGQGEGVHGDGGALMRGLEVVVVAARVVGDDDVGRRYVVVKCSIGELFGDACRLVPRFGRGVVGHEDLDVPRIVGREVEVR